MKTAKALVAADSPSNRRSQPVRQTRTNPPRTSASALNRTLTGRESLTSANDPNQPIDIFPAVTHFADAIAALPKELVRHFTLLREVDAKIFAPEETLFQLIEAALESTPPEPAQSVNDAASTIAPASAPMSAQNSSTGIALNGQVGPAPSAPESVNTAVFDPGNLPRRQLFRQAAFKIQEMLVSLEEKNHVISTANEALSKQLARIDNVWPHLQEEFSDEAKWGSTTHWAYPENRAARALNNQTERTRREGAASLSAAAQALAEEAAARSDARKQAVAAKRNQKNQHQESDFDDHEGKQKGDSNKKSHSTSKRKVAAPPTETPPTVGLGITTASPANGNPTAKRRKVEKVVNGTVPTERAMSTVFGSNAPKAKPSASPRETPVPEPAKKRKALPTSTGQSKKGKSGSGPGMSPSVTSSPVISAFPDNVKVPRASPVPSTTARPASSRARQNSIQSTVENPRQRPSSAASNKPNGAAPTVSDVVTVQSNGSRPASETKAVKEMAAPIKDETPKPESEPIIAAPPAPINTSRKDSVSKVGEEVEAVRDSTPALPVATTTLVTTKSGRASKPSTPALATFAEAARSRPSRSSEGNATVKRSHKKGASAAAAAAAQRALAQQLADEDTNSHVEDEENEIDENEPTYCYCNGVSYGEMVGCDGPDCKREWFHLECVGLKVAPKSNVKWYCEDCKKQLKQPGKKTNGT